MTGDLSKRERFCVQNIFFIAQKRKKRQHFVHFNYPIFNSLKDRKCIREEFNKKQKKYMDTPKYG